MTRLIPVRVLVLDDDPAVCRQVGTWLREAACDAVTFTEPEAALAHAARAACQVALVDLRLGTHDALAVIRQLHAAALAPRIIALAAFPSAMDVIAAIRAGASDVLEKPVQPAAVQDALDRQLAALGILARSEDGFNELLGARLRAVRTNAGRTLTDVAGQAGLTAAQLSQIELGHSATSTWTLARIAAALETPLAELLRTS